MNGKKLDVGIDGARLAANIKAIRQFKGLKYTQLSELMSDAGRPIPTLGLRRIEALERRVDAQDLVAFSNTLGFPVEQLLLSEIRLHASH